MSWDCWNKLSCIWCFFVSAQARGRKKLKFKQARNHKTFAAGTETNEWADNSINFYPINCASWNFQTQQEHKVFDWALKICRDHNSWFIKQMGFLLITAERADKEEEKVKPKNVAVHKCRR